MKKNNDVGYSPLNFSLPLIARCFREKLINSYWRNRNKAAKRSIVNSTTFPRFYVFDTF